MLVVLTAEGKRIAGEQIRPALRNADEQGDSEEVGDQTAAAVGDKGSVMPVTGSRPTVMLTLMMPLRTAAMLPICMTR